MGDSGGAGGGRRMRPALPTWRTVVAAAVATCALPVVLSLALLWLPLLCCAVAAVRFRRVKMSGGRRMGHPSHFRCRSPAEKEDDDDDACGDRVMLLEKYLEDQMELVGADAGEELVADPSREL